MRFPRRETVELLRREYPVGTRVELLRMDDPKGTVRGVDDSGSIMVAWDGGGSLNVLFGVDECRVIKEGE